MIFSRGSKDDFPDLFFCPGCCCLQLLAVEVVGRYLFALANFDRNVKTSIEMFLETVSGDPKGDAQPELATGVEVNFTLHGRSGLA